MPTRVRNESGLLPVPDLSDARVVRAVACIRPCRRGGVRVEPGDELDTPGRRRLLVHNYGHGGCGITLGPGTAPVAADLIRDGSGEGAPVVILGGGAIGMFTALELASRGHAVTLAASAFANDTTSNFAGAIWLPTGLDFPEPGASRERLNAMIRAGHAFLAGLPGEAWGVERLPVYEPYFAEHLDHLYEAGAIDPPTELDALPLPGPPLAGRRFESLFIHTPRFLRALHAEVRARGVRTLTANLRDRAHVRDLCDELGVAAVVNCLALGSKTLFADGAMYPARGHLVHLEPQSLGYIMHNGYHYMFPRSDALVLGGTFEEGVTDTTADPRTVERILAYHRGLFEGRG